MIEFRVIWGAQGIGRERAGLGCWGEWRGGGSLQDGVGDFAYIAYADLCFGVLSSQGREIDVADI